MRTGKCANVESILGATVQGDVVYSLRILPGRYEVFRGVGKFGSALLALLLSSRC
jgi:hypothetical protein